MACALIIVALTGATALPARPASQGCGAHLAPGWDTAMRAGNLAAMKGDLNKALRHYSTLHHYTSDRFMLTYASILVDSAKHAIRDVNAEHLPVKRRYARFERYFDAQWIGNRCNR
jgi:hypothetical protein